MLSIFDPLQFGSLSVDVITAAQQTPAQLAALQRQRLSQLLQSVAQHSPFYRRVLKGCDPATLALHDLPVATKAELMAHFDDWVTDPRLKLAELRAFTADRRRIGEPYLERYLVWESSGTSGEPGIFVQDAHTLALYDALEALRRSTPRPWQRLLDPLGIAERIAFIGATTGHFASQVSAQRLRRINRWMAGTMRSISILQRSADLVADLNRFDPTIVVTYPTAAALLADEFERGALHARPKELWTGGETLSAAARRRLARTFGCSVSNSYGTSEFLPLGWECRFGHMHANTDWVLLEPVDARGRAVPPGELSHTVLITHLGNQLQPIIRYDLGDRIALHDRPCRCGSPFPVIDVRGRCDDALRMQGTDGRTVTLLPLALTTLLEDEAQVFDFQLEQRDASTLLLRLPAVEATSAPVFERCRELLQAFAKRQGLAPIRLIAEAGQPLVHGHSGKVRRVIAAPPPRSRARRRGDHESLDSPLGSSCAR